MDTLTRTAMVPLALVAYRDALAVMDEAIGDSGATVTDSHTNAGTILVSVEAPVPEWHDITRRFAEIMESRYGAPAIWMADTA